MKCVLINVYKIKKQFFPGFWGYSREDANQSPSVFHYFEVKMKMKAPSFSSSNRNRRQWSQLTRLCSIVSCSKALTLNEVS